MPPTVIRQPTANGTVVVTVSIEVIPNPIIGFQITSLQLGQNAVHQEQLWRDDGRGNVTLLDSSIPVTVTSSDASVVTATLLPGQVVEFHALQPGNVVVTVA